jgi:hypothetical protein
MVVIFQISTGKARAAVSLKGTPTLSGEAFPNTKLLL